jgi:hypothetical protein
MVKQPRDAIVDVIEAHVSQDAAYIDEKTVQNVPQVFVDTEDGVNFRTVSWQRAAILFLKIQFAMSILSVPGSIVSLGAVGGALSIVGWQTLNTYTAIIVGNFRNAHPECHSEIPSVTIFPLWNKYL